MFKVISRMSNAELHRNTLVTGGFSVQLKMRLEKLPETWPDR